MNVDEQIYLEHFGIRGMQWGIRKSRKKTGVSRLEGNKLDRNERSKARQIKRLGKDIQKLERNVAKKFQSMDEQEVRIKTGRRTALDTLKVVGSLPLSGPAFNGLFISRRPG